MQVTGGLRPTCKTNGKHDVTAGTRAMQKTRSPAVAKMADRTGCQLHSRSSKVNDFHVICKPICHFLLVITASNLCPIFRRFQNTATYSLKLSILKIAAKPLQMKTWLLLTA